MKDAKILDAIVNAHDEALKNVYAKYRTPFVSWIIKRYSVPKADAQDIFQHAVVIMYENISSGKVTLRGTVKSYLFGIGRNLAARRIKEKSRFTGDPSPMLIDYICDTSQVEEKEQLERDIKTMYRALIKLGDPCKSLLQLFYLEKHSLQSISQLLGYKNANTAKTARFKCLVRLRNLFYEERNPEDSLKS